MARASLWNRAGIRRGLDLAMGGKGIHASVSSAAGLDKGLIRLRFPQPRIFLARDPLRRLRIRPMRGILNSEVEFILNRAVDFPSG
jgi:hypothetical protein